jgi:hypothetical protein
MTRNPLEHLADVKEISIGFRRPDGSTGSTPVWVVQVGGHLFVRSVRGPKGGWYRRLRADPNGEVREGEHLHSVHAEPVADAHTIAEVTRAYATKYPDGRFVQRLLEAPAAGATLRLDSMGPSLREGIWWVQRHDGTWMRWESLSRKWVKPQRSLRLPWVEAPRLPPQPFPGEDVEARGSWSAQNYAIADLEIFKSAVDQLRFVTKMFWEQANFFVVIQGALLTVVAKSLPIQDSKQRAPMLFLSALGLALAAFWGLVAWQRNWIIKQWHSQVRRLDWKVDRHLVYEGVEALLDKKRRRKPTSTTAFVLPWLLAAAWIWLGIFIQSHSN